MSMILDFFVKILNELVFEDVTNIEKKNIYIRIFGVIFYNKRR